MKLIFASLFGLLAVQLAASAVPSHNIAGLRIIEHPDPKKRALLQNLVTWDQTSLFVRGERIMIWSGEVHPFRLPVPSLWFDIFQKVKALGFNCVSFYVDWALVEGKPGNYSAEGVFALEPFFDAASEAGIYLLARPGPYINAEASGGGFPGWLQRIKGRLRTTDTDYLNATQNYASHVAATIAKGQITNGGPIILYQPENEYSGFCCGLTGPDGQYMQDVMDQARAAGVVIPFLSNDNAPHGFNVPGSGVGSVDIYGHDGYPLGFNCANPTVWPAGNLPTTWWQLHLQQSPTTPYSITEFQAGSFDPWGGPGFAKCGALINSEFERVFYKNDLSFSVKILNLYMTYGGTNWGNLGHPGGYTSYDYAAPIAEGRQVYREKYSQLKLLGNFIKVSPAYFDATSMPNSTTLYTNTADLTVTPVKANSSATTFYVLRHTNYTSQNSTSYRLNLPTSAGDLSIPQLGGTLTLNGRDSKIHVTDYDVNGTNILYSTAEIFTWKDFGPRKVLLVYGGPGEHHEISVSSNVSPTLLEGSQSGLTFRNGSSVVVGWDTSSERRIVQVGDLEIYILDRNSAYNYWVPELSNSVSNTSFSSQESTAASIIVQAGYLVRAALLNGTELHLSADFNDTTFVEVIGAPSSAKTLFINGQELGYTTSSVGDWTDTVNVPSQNMTPPSLNSSEWKYIDSLPEIQPTYNDSLWPTADHPTTNNTLRNLTTPMSLYAADYGFHTGSLLYRGHFVAQGNESSIYLNTQGGWAFGSSVWLNQTFLGSWAGVSTQNNTNATYKLTHLQAGQPYVFTVLIDHMGLEENPTVGGDLMKTPRGILNYALAGRDDTAITWKLTGNLGGEDYRDTVRGPLNEGAMYAERQGWHLPNPPSQNWTSRTPYVGISQPGVGFFSTQFDLNIPSGWDVPMSFSFSNITQPPAEYRVQLFVNGFQYGKYINHIGPQTSYPVPPGVLNYQGTNWLALTLWAHQPAGAKLEGFQLVYDTPVRSALANIEFVGQAGYEPRQGAY
ncbi:beta-galactosidase A [Exophiala viscosa]|uniref:beta-galactosidase A n=1 Tax=Exophiala viscosa TaxID=2486360 RepID=UPI0021950BD5|nr:beta-galactosidase A [Exophiala viscosa]